MVCRFPPRNTAGNMRYANSLVPATLIGWNHRHRVGHAVEPTELVVQPAVDPVVGRVRDAVACAPDFTHQRSLRPLGPWHDLLREITGVNHVRLRFLALELDFDVTPVLYQPAGSDCSTGDTPSNSGKDLETFWTRERRGREVVEVRLPPSRLRRFRLRAPRYGGQDVAQVGCGNERANASEPRDAPPLLCGYGAQGGAGIMGPRPSTRLGAP